MSQNIEQEGLYIDSHGTFKSRDQIHQSTVENFERAGKDVLAVVSGTYKEVDKWASQNGIGGRGQKGGIALMMFPHEKRMEGFKNIQTAVDLMVKNF